MLVLFIYIIGKYVFIESSAPRSLFDSAWIQSPIIEATGHLVHCFRFWYHMYGTSTGRLDVYQASGPFVPGHLMWSLKGDQGNSWFQAQIALESVQIYSVRVRFSLGVTRAAKVTKYWLLYKKTLYVPKIIKH